jgi:hypothetical protein
MGRQHKGRTHGHKKQRYDKLAYDVVYEASENLAEYPE